MSTQLLICKYAVFTLFLLMAFVTCMVRWLAVCQDPTEHLEKNCFNWKETILYWSFMKKEENKETKLTELLHLTVEM